jgi:hypothetical protein
MIMGETLTMVQEELQRFSELEQQGHSLQLTELRLMLVLLPKVMVQDISFTSNLIRRVILCG